VGGKQKPKWWLVNVWSNHIRRHISSHRSPTCTIVVFVIVHRLLSSSLSLRIGVIIMHHLHRHHAAVNRRHPLIPTFHFQNHPTTTTTRRQQTF
jgi:hypothetical protein